VLRVANMGPDRAFLGRCVGGADYDFTELVGPSSPLYLELGPTRTRRVDVGEFVNEGISPLRSPLDQHRGAR
jgi:hypothetical protein